MLVLAIVAGACAGCALPKRKAAQASQGPPLAQLQTTSNHSESIQTQPTQPANAGIVNQPIQQVSAYAAPVSSADGIVRHVPEAPAVFEANAWQSGQSPINPATPIVVTAPEPGIYDYSANPVASTESHVQHPTYVSNLPANTTNNAVGLGHGHPAARQLQPPMLAGAANPEMLYGTYTIESGDSLDIRFRNTTELDEVVTVRPDGMISLPIVGDVPAAGLTPEALRQSLMVRYSNDLKQPDIAVIVRSFSGNNVYIGGEVYSPGRIPLVGRVTTLNAVILAGGFRDTADQKRVIVRRADGSCCEYDLKSVIECKGGRDIQLQPYDVVYVPKSHIAKVNQFVDQYIEKVLPFSRSFGIFVSHNTGLTSAVGSP